MGLKSLLTDLSKGEPYGETFPLTSTPATIGNGANTAGFNYGQSLSIFDGNVGEPNRNPFFLLSKDLWGMVHKVQMYKHL